MWVILCAKNEDHGWELGREDDLGESEGNPEEVKRLPACFRPEEVYLDEEAAETELFRLQEKYPQKTFRLFAGFAVTKPAITNPKVFKFAICCEVEEYLKRKFKEND